jgi:hypothetical protein
MFRLDSFAHERKIFFRTVFIIKILRRVRASHINNCTIFIARIVHLREVLLFKIDTDWSIV